MQDNPPRWRLGLEEIGAAMPVIEGFPDFPGRYEGPALVVNGERSGYIKPESHSSFQALFPACRFVTVPGVGHWVHAENPAGFLALIDPFLD
jgi:pimeloyl-ACP methyl ester carboxylesterase